MKRDYRPDEIHSSRLVQRLKKPRDFGGFGFKDNPFSFGGGLKNGGLTAEAMDLIRGIWQFDYMGAAEFEFGAVPEALSFMAEHADELDAFIVSIPLNQVAANWRDKSKKEPEGLGVVYVICREFMANDVSGRIRGWATESYNKDLKESTNLASALRPVEEWDGDTCGWLELDNGFFFFTDKTMWEATCRLLGLETP